MAGNNAESGVLAGRKALITGANQGIGAAVARVFSRAGAGLYLLDANTDGLPALAEEITGLGAAAEFGQGDVTDPASVESSVQNAEQKLGPLDILVNCAGIFQSIAVLDYTLEDWNRVTAVNVTGTFLCAQAVLRRMVERKRGTVINFASAAGRIGGRFRAGYSTSKHAVIGLTRCLAIEFAPHGITANAICPGMVDTDMFASVIAGDAENLGVERDALWERLQMRALQHRKIDPAEIARLALYLASPAAEGMTGQAISYDGGMVMQ